MIKQIIYGKKYRYDLELDYSVHNNISDFYESQRGLDLIVIPRQEMDEDFFYWDKPRSFGRCAKCFISDWGMLPYLCELESRDLELLYED